MVVDLPSPVRGRRQGGGERGRLSPKDCIPYRTANRPPVSNHRLAEILDGQHPPGGSRLDTGSTHPTSTGGDWGWGRGGEKAHRTWGECTHEAPGCLSWLGRGRHKMQVQPSPRFCGTPKGWNRTQRRARSI